MIKAEVLVVTTIFGTKRMISGITIAAIPLIALYSYF